MKIVQTVMTVVVLALAFLLLDTAGLFAEESAASSVIFIDMDGDGINDNASDKDGDGIPDKFAEDAPALPADTNMVGGSAFQFDSPLAGIQLDANALEAPATEQNSKRFAALRMGVRSLSKLRAGLKSGDDFGAGSGSDNMTVKGVTCVGGVCH